MSALPVAHYLRDLSPDGAAPRLRGVAGLATGDAEMVSDIERRVDEARTLGILEGRAAVQAEYDARLQQQAEALEKKFAQERASWVRDQSQRISELIVSQVTAVENRISEQVALVLRPFVEDEVRLRALRELSAQLDKMLVNGDYARISMSGPEDLIAAMQTHLGDKVPGITFIVAEQADVTISADETILESRIGEWVAAIRGGAQ